MGMLNPKLLSDDLRQTLDQAASLRNRYRQPQLVPALILLAMLLQKQNSALRLLQPLIQKGTTDLVSLQRQLEQTLRTQRELDGKLVYKTENGTRIGLSRQTVIMLDEALSIASAREERCIDTDHILLVMTENQLNTSSILKRNGITAGNLGNSYENYASQGQKTVGQFTDHVEEAKKGNLRAVYFREELLRTVMNIISQAVNRHVVLIGPDGVGKRTLAYSLALLIAEGKGPAGIQNLVQLEETALLDNPVRAIQEGIHQAELGILFLTHVHRFFDGRLRTDFAKAASLIQKAFLGSSPLIMAATTEQDYKERISPVRAITENSQLVTVPEPDLEECMAMLRVTQPQLARSYRIEVTDQAIDAASRLAKRYFTTMPLPRSAEHLLHRAAAMVAMSQQSQLAFKPQLADTSALDAQDVTLATSLMTGVPVKQLGEDERARYASMVEQLKKRIIGQDEAILAVSRAIKTARVGLRDEKRPIGAFLLLGPTGVGKTELARALAEFMFGSEENMLALDMSEFKDESSLNRLLGSPSGYVDSALGGQLTERIKKQPYHIVLFDEVEKAHPGILDILLQIIEEGRLTDGRGNTVRFSETVIILTSNLGSIQLSTRLLNDEIRQEVMNEVNTFFRPEFINRLDDIVMFNPLTDTNLTQIMALMLTQEQELAAGRGLKLSYSDELLHWFVSKNKEPQFGARPLRRILQRYLREPLADFLLRENPPNGTPIHIGIAEFSAEELRFQVGIESETPTLISSAENIPVLKE